MTNEAPATGTTAQVIAAPGYPCEQYVTVTEVNGRTLTATYPTIDGQSAETFTLRRNGKWARKGSGQWANYLRFAA